MSQAFYCHACEAYHTKEEPHILPGKSPVYTGCPACATKDADIARLTQALLDADAYNGQLEAVEFVNKELQAKLAAAEADVRALAEALQRVTCMRPCCEDNPHIKYNKTVLARPTVRAIVEGA